jgi:hypothetical protein
MGSTTSPLEILRQGIEILNPVMRAHGFTYTACGSGPSSGGDFARGSFKKDNRIIEIHFRHSLGLVTYHIGPDSLRHEVFMRALLGQAGGNRYPGFSSDPISGFHGLRYDLEHFVSDFLNGAGNDFRRCVSEAKDAVNLSAFQRMEQRWPNALEEMHSLAEQQPRNKGPLVGFAIGIVLFHLALNVVHGMAHARLGIGLNAFQDSFVALVIVVAPLFAAYLIWKNNMRTGGALLALSMAGALVFGLYYHFILPGPDRVTDINLPISFDMRDIFDVSAVLLALFECLGVLAGARIFSKS